MPREIRSAYQELPRHKTHPRGESMAKQSFKDSVDINNILKKYNKTGVIEHLSSHAPEYRFATALTFTEAQQTVAKAQTMFNELPAAARARFNNNPAQFLEYFENYEDTEEAADELFDLGLGFQRAPGSGHPKAGTEEPHPPAPPEPETAPE